MTAVLDLKDKPTKEIITKILLHICATVKIFDHWMGSIFCKLSNMEDLRFRPDNWPLTEIERLQRPQQETIEAWARK
jgi:hypothetical protein